MVFVRDPQGLYSYIYPRLVILPRSTEVDTHQSGKPFYTNTQFIQYNSVSLEFTLCKS